MANFTGLGSNFYTGVVEDRFDPLSLGRVRVRIYGLHTDDKKLISTGDLPWSDVLMPTTSPSISGMGLSPHGLVDGSTVMGFFRDEGDMQDFVVIGSLFGRPSDKYKIPNNDGDKAISRGPDKGFNDSRYPTSEEYFAGPDATKNSSTGRNFELSRHRDGNTSIGWPYRPKEIEQNLDGSGTKIDGNERVRKVPGESYPKKEYTEKQLSDVNKMAQGVYNAYPNNFITKSEGSTVKELPRKGHVGPVYPYNHVIESESGHVIEMDDTPSKERLHLYHRTGTRLEVLADGSQTMKVVNDSYEIVLKDKKILIAGSADIELANGDYNLITKKGTQKDAGNVFITTDGDCNISSSGAIKLKGKVSINGTKFD